MTLDTFFEKFDIFADAPNAVAKMRELVQDLAVRGKVVVQNATDEPAAQLLKRVLAEKTRRTGRVDCSDEEPGSPPDAETFEIPVNWEWVGATTPAVMVSDQGKKVQTKDILEAGKYPVVDQGKMFIRGYCDDSDRVISVADPIVLFGDHTRETKFIDFDFVVGADGVKLLQPICIDPRFYFLVLRWLPLESRGYARHFKLLKAARIPLPPLAEQKRIVAKVDELMALCDRLEAQQQERETRHFALARASLARFADAPTPANLDFIFHSSFSIPPSDLRKSILTLAVQGKLVPQDPNDEPADVFLGLIAQRLGKSKGKRSTNNGAAIADEAEPFDLPPGWAWSRFHDLGEFGRGKSKHRPRNDRSLFMDGKHRLVQTGDVARANGTIETHTGLYNDVGLAQSKMWPAGTLCITIAANIADSGILGFDACFPDSVVGFIPAPPIPSVRYFEYFMRTAKEHLEQFAPATAQKNINLGILEQVWIPIPPLAEQRRIVAKVEQLMALVDELETQLAASRATAKNLLQALVAEFTT